MKKFLLAGLTLSLSTGILFANEKEKAKYKKEFTEGCMSNLTSISEKTAKAYCDCSAERYVEYIYKLPEKNRFDVENEKIVEIIKPCTEALEAKLYSEAKQPNSDYRNLSISKCIAEMGESVDKSAATKYCTCAIDELIKNLSPKELKEMDALAAEGADLPDQILKLTESCTSLLGITE